MPVRVHGADGAVGHYNRRSEGALRRCPRSASAAASSRGQSKSIWPEKNGPMSSQPMARRCRCPGCSGARPSTLELPGAVLVLLKHTARVAIRRVRALPLDDVVVRGLILVAPTLDAIMGGSPVPARLDVGPGVEGWLVNLGDSRLLFQSLLPSTEPLHVQHGGKSVVRIALGASLRVDTKWQAAVVQGLDDDLDPVVALEQFRKPLRYGPYSQPDSALVNAAPVSIDELWQSADGYLIATFWKRPTDGVRQVDIAPSDENAASDAQGTFRVEVTVGRTASSDTGENFGWDAGVEAAIRVAIPGNQHSLEAPEYVDTVVPEMP